MNHRLFQNVLEYDELASTNAEAKLLLTNLKGKIFWCGRNGKQQVADKEETPGIVEMGRI